MVYSFNCKQKLTEKGNTLSINTGAINRSDGVLGRRCFHIQCSGGEYTVYSVVVIDGVHHSGTDGAVLLCGVYELQLGDKGSHLSGGNGGETGAVASFLDYRMRCVERL